jgi:hypothetical protein
MANTDTQAAVIAPAIQSIVLNAASVNDEFPLSLDEFCSRLSSSDKRVEMIGAFHHTEKAAGHNKDIESAYIARYSAFINQPA